MLGFAQAPQALAFQDEGLCAVMAAPFVDNSLDQVDHWLFLWLSKIWANVLTGLRLPEREIFR